jgi:hypothetical protein
VQYRKAAGRVNIWKGQKDLAEMLITFGDEFAAEFPSLDTPQATRTRLLSTFRRSQYALDRAFRSACAVLANQADAPTETQDIATALLQSLLSTQLAANAATEGGRKGESGLEDDDESCTIQ